MIKNVTYRHSNEIGALSNKPSRYSVQASCVRLVLFVHKQKDFVCISSMEIKLFISASEIPLVVSAIEFNLTGKFWTNSGKMIIKLV